MSTIKVVQGDANTRLIASITTKDLSGNVGPKDLSGTTVLMHVREAASTEDTFVATGELLTGYVDIDGNTVTGPYTTAGTGGRVQFQFPSGALSITPGMYEIEIEIVQPGGGSETVYDLYKMLVRA